MRSTHGVNCTGSCSWKIYVKGGIVTWETQQTDYPRTRADLPNHEPRGCARGGAFPSAHVSGAVVVSLVAWRHQPRLAYLLVPIAGSVMIATVYGRFHYVLDALAGAGLALAVVAAYRYLSRVR